MTIIKSKVGPITNVNVKSKAEDITTPATLRRIFVFAHFVFGLHNGYVEVKNQKFLYILTIIQSTVVFSFVFYYLISLNEFKMTWVNLEAIIYMCFVIINLRNRYTYYDFQYDLERFDERINADSRSYKFTLKFVAFLLFIITIIISGGIPLFKNRPLIVNIQTLPAILLIIMSNDFVRITFVFVFSCARWRMKNFIEFIKKDSIDIIDCQHLYRNIVDVVERAKNNYNFVFLVTLIYNTATATAILFLPFIENTVKTVLFNLNLACL
ncbi:hypothetical protein ACJJTC_016978 [Scirpophaga incertulas]